MVVEANYKDHWTLINTFCFLVQKSFNDEKQVQSPNKGNERKYQCVVVTPAADQ